MRYWAPSVLADVDAAIEAARRGDPTVALVEGAAGMGKSSLLAEVGDRATGFLALHAGAAEGDATPYGVLAQWGIDAGQPVDGTRPHPIAAAHALLDLLDAAPEGTCTLLLLDDLHWADPESVEALTWIARRAGHRHLLVVAASRPLVGDTHPACERWVTKEGSRLCRIVLSGLTERDGVRLIQSRWPGTDRADAVRLWEHTGHNPLYLTALLDEQSPELAASAALPAPAAFTRTIIHRLTSVSPAAAAFLDAAAVLGAGWETVLDIDAVAGKAGGSSAVDELIGAGLVELRTDEGPAAIRFTHALVKAAVYQHIGLVRRRLLHRRAAAAAVGEASILRHRMAAAEAYDAALADQMEVFADGLYEERSFRQAAQFRRWASSLTPDPPTRERRWLSSLFESVLARDLALVHREIDDVANASDPARRALVLGALAIWERRRREGIDVLDRGAPPDASGLPPDERERLVRYRIEVLRTWAQLCSGYPTALVADGLRRVQAVQVVDAGLSGLEMIVTGQLAVRELGPRRVLDDLAGLPAHPASVALHETGRLAWRGALQARIGLLRPAAADLSEAVRRIHDGVTGLGAGAFHAQLGFVQWLGGEWDRAAANLALASQIGGPHAHPMTLAVAPVSAAGAGRFDEADRAIERARAELEDGAWPEACQLLSTALIIRAHARGSSAEQSRLIADLEGTILEPSSPQEAGPLAALHLVQAWIWARRLHEAEAGIRAMEEADPHPPWVPAATHWLRGLVLEACGDLQPALTELTSAIAATSADVPLYRAHMLGDHGRLAQLLGRPEAAASLMAAEDGYRRLGAAPYVERTAQLVAASNRTVDRVVLCAPLTEREQAVLTQMVVGMSYAQISKELFISQSTVGYHLRNIYAKAGVSSRHRLAQLVREDPRAFGLTATTA